MKNQLSYSRWVLTITISSLVGLLAVSMLTVHWKREIRSVGSGIRITEARLEDLERGQDTLDTELAHNLNPERLKGLLAVSNLRLAPPDESRIIVVRSANASAQSSYYPGLDKQSGGVKSRWELAESPRQGKD